LSEFLSVDLLEIIKNELLRPRRPTAVRLPTFYPSSASAIDSSTGDVIGGCRRADWYRVNRVSKSNSRDFYLAMIHELGNAVESTVVKAMMKAGIFESTNVKLYDPRTNLSGELDVVGRYRKKDSSIGYYGVEVKSVYGMGVTMSITGRQRAWRGQPAFRPKPKDNNLMQSMVYTDFFSPERDPEFSLEGFKLIYLPRDKPIDGRHYDIMLVTREALTGSLLSRHGPSMSPGEHYALISTKGYPDYVETRFSIEDIKNRFAAQKEMFASGVVPERTFKKFYSASEVETRYSNGSLSKTAYEKYHSGKDRPGHFLCQRYCDYRDHCYKRNGDPRPEADQLVQITT